jgi:protein-S-isoprenylcysteine O-methyltransferase Ste14
MDFDMREKLIVYILGFQNKKSSTPYKCFSLSIGALFFLVILPSFFIWIGSFVDNYFSLNGSEIIKYSISFLTIIIGLFFLFWTTVTQLKIGHGTPVPNAPTQRLIITGPYKLMRNPIEFGAILYYFGLGTITCSYTVGIVCFLLGLACGSSYHKFIEEKELERRFGEDYIKYRQNVPFLIPRIKINKLS